MLNALYIAQVQVQCRRLHAHQCIAQVQVDAANHKEHDNDAEDKQNSVADHNAIIVVTVICIRTIVVFRLKACNCIFLQRTWMIVNKSQGQFINNSSFPGDGFNADCCYKWWGKGLPSTSCEVWLRHVDCITSSNRHKIHCAAIFPSQTHPLYNRTVPPTYLFLPS